MDHLGRYYTNNSISTLLIENVSSKHPKRVLDLGIGDASLSLAAYSKWDRATYCATEIEEKKAYEISQKLPFIQLIQCDTLSPDVATLLAQAFGQIDLAICNPPYKHVPKSPSFESLFESIGCPNFGDCQQITSEIVFFSYNILLLKDRGELAIILSDSLMTGKNYRLFRESILTKFDVQKVIQLPDGIFKKTEARTHIMFLSKQLPVHDTCELFTISEDYSLCNQIAIKKASLVNRMDHRFHFEMLKYNFPTKNIGNIGAQISRGRFTKLALEKRGLPFFHSTDFKRFGDFAEFLDDVPEELGLDIARKGDILICRVGKRSVGRFVLVMSGSILYSDCIFRIRCPDAERDGLVNSLKSPSGKAWIRAYSHGVCSLVLSKSDLTLFPIQ